VKGKPDVYPRYGDRQGAWAQRNTDANQFIEVIVIDFEVSDISHERGNHIVITTNGTYPFPSEFPL
jgi:hypothetical protein